MKGHEFTSQPAANLSVAFRSVLEPIRTGSAEPVQRKHTTQIRDLDSFAILESS
jgi:hypothetical protein